MQGGKTVIILYRKGNPHVNTALNCLFIPCFYKIMNDGFSVHVTKFSSLAGNHGIIPFTTLGKSKFQGSIFFRIFGKNITVNDCQDFCRINGRIFYCHMKGSISLVISDFSICALND